MPTTPCFLNAGDSTRPTELSPYPRPCASRPSEATCPLRQPRQAGPGGLSALSFGAAYPDTLPSDLSCSNPWLKAHLPGTVRPRSCPQLPDSRFPGPSCFSLSCWPPGPCPRSSHSPPSPWASHRDAVSIPTRLRVTRTPVTLPAALPRNSSQHVENKTPLPHVSPVASPKAPSQLNSVVCKSVPPGRLRQLSCPPPTPSAPLTLPVSGSC